MIENRPPIPPENLLYPGVGPMAGNAGSLDTPEEDTKIHLKYYGFL